MQLKNLKTGGVCCCGCDYDAWQITVSQSLVGYGGFVCENSEPSDSRYLSYNVSCDAGFTGNWCGGGAQPTKNISVTTNIDPFTGLTCTQGLPPNGYTCAGGNNCEENCTETSRTYTCDARPEDCAGEGVETIQTRYSLSVPNTIDAVIGRANSLLNSFGAGSLPGPNTSGTVKVGSGGQAVLAWQALSGEPSASRWTSRGVAQLTKSIVKLKRDLRYKIVSYDEYGDSSEQEFDGVKDQVIYLNPPPSSDGSKYFRAGQQCSTIPVTLEVESTNQLTTKTLRTAPPPGDGDEPEDQPCTTFIIGPDCKSYTTRTTTTNCSSSASGSTNCDPSGSANSSSSYSKTTVETACSPSQSSVTDSTEGSYNDSYCSGYSESGSRTCANGKWSETYTDSNGGNTPDEGENESGLCGADSSCESCTIICGECSQEIKNGSGGRYVTESTQQLTGTSTPYGSSQTSELKWSYDSSKDDPPSWGYPLTACGDKPCTRSGSSSCNCSTTISYSGEVSNAFDEEGARFDTESWTQQGGLCAWKALATNGTMNESTANITIYVSVNGDPEKDYNVEVQMVVESNTTQNNCSFRSYDAYVQTLSMKGGEVRQAGRSLSANNGQTKCMVHSAAVAYEA